LYERLKTDFGSIVDGMQNQYLNNITLRGDSLYDGLFSQQLEDMISYMRNYGVDNNTMIDNLRSLQPRLEYIGQRNLGLIYGDTNQKSIEQIIDIVDNTRTKKFLSEMQKSFAKGDNIEAKNSLQYFFDTAGDILNLSRRWGQTRMLGGLGLLGDISTRFFIWHHWAAVR
jgi:hypothetical protein